MGVDHRRCHIRVAQVFLHGANFTARLQQVRGETVPQRVRRGRLGDSGLAHGPLERPLEGFVIEMVTPDDAAARVCGIAVLRRATDLPQLDAARGYLRSSAWGISTPA